MRRFHNQIKKDLITKWVKPKSFILDCGCGRGGDLWKWKDVDARVVAIDPDADSIQEAEERARTAQIGVWFLPPGDIRQAVSSGPFDVVCYNFSIQYIVDSFEESIRAIKKSIKPGGFLIGVTPEKSLIEGAKSPDSLGNTFEIHGSSVMVRIVDGPFYADGPRPEPLLEKSVLQQALCPEFQCLVWEPISSKTGTMSDVYARFVFLRL